MLSRRRFVSLASNATALIGAHETMVKASPISAESAPRILNLELQCAAPLPAMKELYHERLGLTVLEEGPRRLTIAGGATLLTFVQVEGVADEPFYHFAFNIPENKVEAAWKWQNERTALLPIPERLRDPNYPDGVVNYSHWNAHSVFFLDPGGNVVEYIGRHDLNNAAPGDFSSQDILYASEIAIIVDDVVSTAAKLADFVGVSQYKGGSELFTALGDEHGLLLVMKRGRILNFNPSSQEKAARIFRTYARVRGVRSAQYSFADFPYEVAVEA
jgi:hypothetical protein